MAKNDPASIVAGAGLLTGIFTKINAAVLELGGTPEDLHRLTKPEGDAIIRAMARHLVEAMNFTVDYDSPWLTELDWYSRNEIPGFFGHGDPSLEDFAKLHSLRYGKHDTEFAVVTLPSGSTPKELFEEMERQALRRPNTAEVWAFFRNARPHKHPEVWLCGQIVNGEVVGFRSDGHDIFPYWYALNEPTSQLVDYETQTYLAVRK